MARKRDSACPILVPSERVISTLGSAFQFISDVPEPHPSCSLSSWSRLLQVMAAALRVPATRFAYEDIMLGNVATSLTPPYPVPHSVVEFNAVSVRGRSSVDSWRQWAGRTSYWSTLATVTAPPPAL